MCGIAGVIDFKNPRPDERLLRRMIGIMRHRGPDAAGIYMNRFIGLAHTRLSIIDLSGGDQPIHNEDRTIWSQRPGVHWQHKTECGAHFVHR